MFITKTKHLEVSKIIIINNKIPLNIARVKKIHYFMATTYVIFFFLYDKNKLVIYF